MATIPMGAHAAPPPMSASRSRSPGTLAFVSSTDSSGALCRPQDTWHRCSRAQGHAVPRWQRPGRLSQLQAPKPPLIPATCWFPTVSRPSFLWPPLVGSALAVSAPSPRVHRAALSAPMFVPFCAVCVVLTYCGASSVCLRCSASSGKARL